jgi:hypothetical protein
LPLGGINYLNFNFLGTDNQLAMVFAGILATLIFSAVRNTRTLYQAEPIPSTASDAPAPQARRFQLSRTVNGR